MRLISKHSGFTLIELSIVLVIIGLIVGGVLVGRDLIAAAAVRAQISQVEQLQAATNTFRGKYNALPGDIPAALVAQFGFTTIPTRNGTAGEGDGNGILDGICCGGYFRFDLASGETTWFWTDLANNARMIAGNFISNATPNVGCTGPGSPSRMFPQAKIGNDNYIWIIAVYSLNWFTLTSVSIVDGCGSVGMTKLPLTVAQAAAIDGKMDDGYPQSGAVQAFYSNLYIGGVPTWSTGAGVSGPADTSATAASSTTCYDNNNVNLARQLYSLTSNKGAGVNCALSFRFQ